MPVKKCLVGALFCSLLLFSPGALAASVQYSLGDSGPAVTQIQTGLKDAGYYGGLVDGKFSILTRQAVISFQKAVGLKADGVVEAKTYKALTGKAIPQKAAGPSGQKLDKPDKNAGKILATALSYRGVKYRFGGATPAGFDCSGFVMYVYNKHGIKLPRTADIQFKAGKPIKGKKDLKPGDLVFFETYEKGASHVGIYQGNDKFVHASSSRGVTISGLSEAYYAKRYLGARRVL
jgi:cell wall-associated NlpC family hydrolase